MPIPLRRSAAPIVISALIAFTYWPGLYGFWGRDDFMQLAFARLIGSPWPLFVHDHYFPVPGSIFRPLGFASFWLWQALFGTNYFAHAFADMLLHVAVSLALYRVIRAGALERVPAALCTLLFALHPAVLGTALWWSARFDLLAALFALIGIRGALDYIDRPRITSLLVALSATLAALLSKETALAAVAAIGLIWLRACWRGPLRRADALPALVGLAIVVLVFFMWRWIVLGTVASGLAGDTSLIGAIAHGFVDWIRHLAGYLSYWPRLGAAERLMLVAAVVASTACFIAAARRRGTEPRSSRPADLLFCGVWLFLLPALLQAPVVALNAARLGADVSAVEAAMQSRLYYLSIAGAVIVLSVAMRLALSRRGGLGIPLLAALALGVCAFAWTSRESASAYATRTAIPRAMAEAAAGAVDRLALPAAQCHVVVLGVEPPAEWSVYVSMDSVVKALSANLDKVGRCFIHSDYQTYFHLMDARVTPSDAAPYRQRETGRGPLPWLHIGDAAVAYLDPPAHVAGEQARGIVFLRYENGVFRDVTGDIVKEGISIDLR